jgi:hypothetical protein
VLLAVGLSPGRTALAKRPLNAPGVRGSIAFTVATYIGGSAFMESRPDQSASLQRTVALVTGASRGVGKGVALGLGEAGIIAYLTGRTKEISG